MASCSFIRLGWFCLAFPALLLAIGCNDASSSKSKEASSNSNDATSNSNAGETALPNSPPNDPFDQVATERPKSELSSRQVSSKSTTSAKKSSNSHSDYRFEAPQLLTAAGEPIRVEEPGYACPTLFDIDKDGAEDLIVGQFSEGKMKWYKNLSSPGETPTYGAGEWIKSGDLPAVVPGVS